MFDETILLFVLVFVFVFETLFAVLLATGKAIILPFDGVFVVLAVFPSPALPTVIDVDISAAAIVVSLFDATIFVNLISPLLPVTPLFVLKAIWKTFSSVFTKVCFVNVIFPVSDP